MGAKVHFLSNVGRFRSLRGRINRWAVEDGVVVEHRGIKLSQMIFSKSNPGEFVYWTKLALDLVEAADPRRMARIQRELDYIVDTELPKLAGFVPGRICEVDFVRCKIDELPEWRLPMYAALLIHEATHGHLIARGVTSTRQNRLRIEKICRAEENRFLSRIESPWGENLRKPFHPEDWKRQSRFELMRAWWRSIQTRRTKANPSRDERARLEILGAEVSNGVPLATVRMLFDEKPRRYRFVLGFEGYETLDRLFDVSASRRVGSDPDRFFFLGGLPTPLSAECRNAAVRIERGDTFYLVTLRLPKEVVEHLSWFAELEDPEQGRQWEVADA